MCYNGKAVLKRDGAGRKEKKNLKKSSEKLLTDGKKSAIIARLTLREGSERRAKPRAKKT